VATLAFLYLAELLSGQEYNNLTTGWILTRRVEPAISFSANLVRRVTPHQIEILITIHLLGQDF
jgi:hypothetical protein